MKERIESKLGCTIEEYLDNLHKKIEYGKKMDWETEEPSDLANLSIDEIRFISDYIKRLRKKTA